MSYADRIFKRNIDKITRFGTSSEGEEVRAKWEDGTPAHTMKLFGLVNSYDLRLEFPAITIRPTNIRAAFDELLWIWQKKSNDVKDLNSHIWDAWADKEGKIGAAYGYQIGKRYLHHYCPMNEIEELKEKYPSAMVFPSGKDMLGVYLDQIDGVLYDLKHNPFSRRIMTNIYNFEDLHLMNLYPCAYSMTFNVTKEIGENGVEELYLNGILNQRSQDMLVANNWNVVQYTLLLMMIAQSVGMKVGKLIHVIADAHIYDRHVEIVENLLKRECYDAPKVYLNPDMKDFYDFTVDDLMIEDYVTGPQVKNIPVAV